MKRNCKACKYWQLITNYSGGICAGLGPISKSGKIQQFIASDSESNIDLVTGTVRAGKRKNKTLYIPKELTYTIHIRDSLETLLCKQQIKVQHAC